MPVKHVLKRLSIAAAVLAAPLAVYAASAPEPRITEDQAREIALKAAPGTVVKSEYEKEDGGWRYSFDIRQGDRIHEIGVDAFTGKIVEDSFESPDDKD
jgi:uncharacterized membrane protein YkoI